MYLINNFLRSFSWTVSTWSPWEFSFAILFPSSLVHHKMRGITFNPLQLSLAQTDVIMFLSNFCTTILHFSRHNYINKSIHCTARIWKLLLIFWDLFDQSWDLYGHPWHLFNRTFDLYCSIQETEVKNLFFSSAY